MELSKVRTMEQIIASFKDGQTIAIGGQTNNYMPERLIDCVLESGAKHLTVYSIDSSDPGMGISRIIEAGRVDKMITTHVGNGYLHRAHPLRRHGPGRRAHQDRPGYRGGGGQAGY